MSVHQLADVADRAGDGTRRGGEWAREEGTAALPLSSLEVAVARAHRVLPGCELVAVHRDAHRASRLAPLRTRGHEYIVQPLGHRLFLHLLRAGDDEHADTGRDLATAQHARRETQIGDTRIGAAPDED